MLHQIFPEAAGCSQGSTKNDACQRWPKTLSHEQAVKILSKANSMLHKTLQSKYSKSAPFHQLEQDITALQTELCNRTNIVYGGGYAEDLPIEALLAEWPKPEFINEYNATAASAYLAECEDNDSEFIQGEESM